MEDNQACIALTKNPEDHKRTKHVQVKYHVIRDYVKRNLVKFTYCPTENQLADIFTKAVSGVTLRGVLKKIGLIRPGQSYKLGPISPMVGPSCGHGVNIVDSSWSHGDTIVDPSCTPIPSLKPVLIK